MLNKIRKTVKMHQMFQMIFGKKIKDINWTDIVGWQIGSSLIPIITVGITIYKLLTERGYEIESAIWI